MRLRNYQVLPFAYLLLATLFFTAPAAKAQLLFDNGPIFNQTGTGAGGANVSVLLTTTFGMGTIGFGHQQTAFNRVADDFVVSDCRWVIDSIVFFGYQTNSTTTSTFTGVTLRVWDSIPDAAGSAVVYGDTTTNRMTRTAWSGVYRTTETTITSTARPIMRNVLTTNGLVLESGTYWLDWASSGSLASGPWAPPRVPAGLAITGNGRQRTGGVWNNAVDGGTGTPAQGFPFLIYGHAVQPTVDAGPDAFACTGGSATLGGTPTASGGTGSLTYAWSPATGLSSTTAANPVCTNTSSATYVVVVTDSIGCSVTDTVNYTYGAAAGNFLYADTAICSGGTIMLTATSGSSYAWSTGDTTQSVTVGPGTYMVSVGVGPSCFAMDTIVVGTEAGVSVSGDTLVCAGDSAMLMADLTGGAYLWSPSGQSTQSIYVTQAGSYSVQYVSAQGCSSSASINVAASQAPVASFNYTATGLTVQFNDLSGASNATYLWSFGDNNTSTQQNPSHTFGMDGGYFVTLYVTNECGTDSTSMMVGVVGVSGSMAQGEIEVSPNPASDQFVITIKGVDAGDVQVSMTDLQGKVVGNWNMESAGNELRLNVASAGFARGTYFLQFKQNGATQIRKVVLN